MGSNESQIKMWGKFGTKRYKALVINCMKNALAGRASMLLT